MDELYYNSMNSSLYPKSFFDGQVMNINPIDFPGEKNLSEVNEDWNMFEHVTGAVRNGIFCGLLQSKIRICNFVSCTFYRKCHNDV